ncbi:hypothetical protein PInf_014615 [Phytophthora infestans]|nr:hypothetical protein PInf_014615 [Phytophthora infestans]
MDRSDFSHMNDSQFESVRKMAGIFGMEALQSLVVSTPAKQLERVNAFDAYEQGLIAHVRESLQAPAAEANPPRPKPIRLKVKPYEEPEVTLLAAVTPKICPDHLEAGLNWGTLGDGDAWKKGRKARTFTSAPEK